MALIGAVVRWLAIRSRGPAGGMGPTHTFVAASALLLSSSLAASGPAADGSGDIPADAVDLAALAPLNLVEEARIGRSPGSSFRQIEAVDVDAAGRIHLYDAGRSQIRILTPGGAEIRTIAWSGVGRGGYLAPVRIGARGDTIWAIDSSGGISLFDTSGADLGTHPVEPVSAMIPPTLVIAGIDPAHFREVLLVPDRLEEDGAFGSRILQVARPLTRGATPADPDTAWVPRVRFAPTGEVLDTAAWQILPPRQPIMLELVEIAGRIFASPQPPDDQPLSLALPGGGVVIDRAAATSARPATFTVTWFDRLADPVGSVTLAYEPVSYPEAYLARAAMQATMDVGGTFVEFEGTGVPIRLGGGGRRGMGSGRTDYTAEMRSRMSFPRYQTPVQRAFVARDGALWLRREEQAQAHYRWLLLGADHRVVGEAVLPAGARPLWAEGDRLLTAERAAGSDHLVVYRVSRTGA